MNTWAPWLVGAAGLQGGDWLLLLGHFAVFSLLAIGGAIAVAPEMHRVLVVEHGWIGDASFTASLALAQAAPGPNVLFVAVLGWNVGGALGVAAAMAGILLPSTLLAVAAGRYGRARAASRGVRAFAAGMAPLTVGLLFSTGWILTEPFRWHAGALVLTLATAVWTVRRKVSPLWPITFGALAGALGLAG